MRVAWDLRLFSLGYAGRGIGVYTQAVASAILASPRRPEIVVIGNRESVGRYLPPADIDIIECSPGGWRRDLLRLPGLLRGRRIDILHYWVALGPLHRLGMSAIPPCPVCATVYDLGVDLWHEAPFLRAVRRSWYWRVQKFLARRLAGALCISEATRTDFARLLDRKSVV